MGHVKAVMVQQYSAYSGQQQSVAYCLPHMPYWLTVQLTGKTRGSNDWLGRWAEHKCPPPPPFTTKAWFTKPTKRFRPDMKEIQLIWSLNSVPMRCHAAVFSVDTNCDTQIRWERLPSIIWGLNRHHFLNYVETFIFPNYVVLDALIALWQQWLRHST